MSESEEEYYRKMAEYMSQMKDLENGVDPFSRPPRNPTMKRMKAEFEPLPIYKREQ